MDPNPRETFASFFFDVCDLDLVSGTEVLFLHVFGMGPGVGFCTYTFSPDLHARDLRLGTQRSS